jgi:replicative DNA helicase
MKQLSHSDQFTPTDSHTSGDDLPNAVQAEFSLLGKIFYENNLLDRLSFLSPEHFWVPEHGEIFQFMLDMRAKGDPITPITLSKFYDIGSDIGTPRYLAKAMDAAVVCFSPIEDAQVIVEMATKRSVIAELNRQLREIKSGGRTAAEIIGEINTGLSGLLQAGTMTKFQTDRELAVEILHRMRNPLPSYSTGLQTLDRAMEGGINQAMNYLLLGRKKMGKTTLASTISYNLAQPTEQEPDGVKHLFIAAEMKSAEIFQRVLARMLKTYASNFRGQEARENYDLQHKLEEQIKQIRGNIIFLTAPSITFERLRKVVAEAQSLYRIKGFFLDSLQLVGGKAARTSRVEHQDEVAQWCAEITRQEDIFSVVTAQMNQFGNVRFGEGCRLACDQAFELRAPEDDPSMSARYIEMLETRHTGWMNIGDETSTCLTMDAFGPYIFEGDYISHAPLSKDPPEKAKRKKGKSREVSQDEFFDQLDRERREREG